MNARPEALTFADVRHLEGESLTALLSQFRTSVCDELVEAGLSRDSARARTDAVFLRWVESRVLMPEAATVQSSLLEVARTVADESKRQSRESRIRSDGYFGSGMW